MFITGGKTQVKEIYPAQNFIKIIPIAKRELRYTQLPRF